MAQKINFRSAWTIVKNSLTDKLGNVKHVFDTSEPLESHEGWKTNTMLFNFCKGLRSTFKKLAGKRNVHLLLEKIFPHAMKKYLDINTNNPGICDTEKREYEATLKSIANFLNQSENQNKSADVDRIRRNIFLCFSNDLA